MEIKFWAEGGAHQGKDKFRYRWYGIIPATDTLIFNPWLAAGTKEVAIGAGG